MNNLKNIKMNEDSFEQNNIDINNQNPQRYGNQNNDIILNNQPKKLGPNEEVTIMNFYKKSSNPIVALITVILKLSSIICFFILSIFISNEALIMIIIILLGSADFWMTKNISGRILVGLRWYNLLKIETNQEIWRFEGKNEIKETNADRVTFWTSLYLYNIIWIILFIWELIRINFDWSFICLVLCILAFTNTYGFFRCSSLQQKGALYVAKKYFGGNKK